MLDDIVESGGRLGVEARRQEVEADVDGGIRPGGPQRRLTSGPQLLLRPNWPLGHQTPHALKHRRNTVTALMFISIRYPRSFNGQSYVTNTEIQF